MIGAWEVFNIVFFGAILCLGGVGVFLLIVGGVLKLVTGFWFPTDKQIEDYKQRKSKA